MNSSYIPQRMKRAKQQITVKLYEDQVAMLDSYGRFINDTREYIISEALNLVFKKDKEFARWLKSQEQSKNGQPESARKRNVSEVAHAERRQTA